MQPLTRKLVRSLGLPLFGAGLAFLLAEVLLRLFPGLLSEDARLRLHWRDLLAGETRSIAHPTIGFLYPPGGSGTFDRGDLHFRYQLDAEGFRNPDPWPDPVDIVAVGDSLTFGYGVEDEQSWPWLLATRGTVGTVRNLGLIGACASQEQRIYALFGAPRRPAVLLFCVFPANDIPDELKFRKWLAAGSPGNFDVWRFAPAEGARSRLLGLLQSSYLFTQIQELARQSAARREYPARRHACAEGGMVQLNPGILANAVRPAGHPDLEQVLDVIGETAERAAEDGTQTVVVLLPSKEETYLPVLDLPCPDAIGPFVQGLAARGLRAIDLRPPFQAAAGAGQQLFFEVDGHPNERGYRLIADEVERYLHAHRQELGLAR